MDMWYIKLYRKLKDNPIAYNLELLWLLSFILMDVNFKENTFYRWSKKIVVKPWEKIFSQRWYSERFWVSLAKIHRYLKILSNEWILKHEWNSNFTILKLNNWDTYNWSETQMKTKWKPDENQMKTNNKEKNIKKDNNIINYIDDEISNEISPIKNNLTFQELLKEKFNPDFISNINNRYKLNSENFKEQVELFVIHWTEKSENWKKERRQKEKTFDIQKRFYKWLNNNEKWGNPQKNNNSWIIYTNEI